MGNLLNDYGPCCLPCICFWYLLRSLLLSAVGAVKGLIVLVPVAIITIPTWASTAVLCWPRDICYTYYTVAVTKKLGPNLRALALLLLPIPLLLYPVLLIILSFFFSLGLGFFWPMAVTIAVDDITKVGKILTTGITEPIKCAKDWVVSVWDFNARSYFRFLDEMRAPYYGEPLDISLPRMLLCLALSLACGLVSFVMLAVLGAIKLVPALVRAYVEYARMLKTSDVLCLCLWVPFWLVGLGVIPFLVVGAYAVVLLGAFLYLGPAAGIMAYAYSPSNWTLCGATTVSFVFMYARVREVNNDAAKAIGSRFAPCLLLLPELRAERMLDGRSGRAPWAASTGSSSPNNTATWQQQGHSDPGTHYTDAPAEDDPASRAWATLRDVTSACAVGALSWGWLRATDLEDAEPFVFIGLPSMALMQLMLDAAAVSVRWPAPARAPSAEAHGRSGSAIADAADAGSETINPVASLQQGAGAVGGGGDGRKAGGAAAAAAAVPGGALAPKAAQCTLEDIADHLLGRDIGFKGCANPARLHKELKALKATNDELLYMACHLLTMGQIPPSHSSLAACFAAGAGSANAAADVEAGAGGCELPAAAQLRRSQLHAFTAAVQSAATALSRKPQSNAIMSKVIAKSAEEQPPSRMRGRQAEQGGGPQGAGADGMDDGSDGGAASGDAARSANGCSEACAPGNGKLGFGEEDAAVWPHA